jgi:AraC-like DNA-binding protein
MPRPSPDFFRYLPCPPEAGTWGLAVTGGGQLRNAPGSPYPPAGHPPDHAFAWDHGRVLPAWQIVFIAAGRGRFESRHQPLRDITDGTALVLFPGEWHRYAPDRRTGWTELWVELQGPACARLEAAGEWSAGFPCVDLDHAPSESLLRRIHALLRGRDDASPGFSPESSAAAWELVARIADARRYHQRRVTPPLPITRAVRRAEDLLAERLDAPPSMRHLARELGVAYSYFRREFRRQTGLAPRAWMQRLRLEKARRLLGNSRATLAEVAGTLGFSSPYHLSAAFKRAFGASPDRWRRGLDTQSTAMNGSTAQNPASAHARSRPAVSGKR